MKTTIKRELLSLDVLICAILCTLVLFFLTATLGSLVKAGRIYMTSVDYLRLVVRLLAAMLSFWTIQAQAIRSAQDYYHGTIYVYMEAYGSRGKYITHRLVFGFLKSLVIFLPLFLASLYTASWFSDEGTWLIIQSRQFEFSDLVMRSLWGVLPQAALLFACAAAGLLAAHIKPGSTASAVLAATLLWLVSLFMINFQVPGFAQLALSLQAALHYEKDASMILVVIIGSLAGLALGSALAFATHQLLIQRDIIWKVNSK